MKRMVTYVDATEQIRKNRVACSFCMNERRSCDAKTMVVRWVRSCSGNGKNHSNTMYDSTHRGYQIADFPLLHPSVCKARHV